MSSGEVVIIIIIVGLAVATRVMSPPDCAAVVAVRTSQGGGGADEGNDTVEECALGDGKLVLEQPCGLDRDHEVGEHTSLTRVVK